MSKIIVNISEAKVNLSKYAKLVKQGKTVLLAERNVPFAEISQLKKTSESIVQKRKKMLGSLKGTVQIVGDINSPLSKEELAEWYKDSV